MSLTAAARGRAPPAARAQASGAAHQVALDRAFGRIFAVFLALAVAAFWASSGTLAGQRPGGVAANVLLSVLLTGQALLAVRRPPSQRDLVLLAAATGSLLLVSRALAVPGSPFLVDYNPAVVVPVAAAWAVWSDWFVVPVPVLLVVVVQWAWNPARDLAAEQAVVDLAIVACTAFAARLLQAGARRADEDADVLSRRMAAQDAALAAEEAGRRAANAVHDDVLSVLRAVSVADRPLRWPLLVSKARRAQGSLARQVPRGGYGVAGLAPALRRRALDCAAELDVRCDLDGDLDVPLSAVEALSAAAGEALRNVAAHARAGRAEVAARRTGSGGVMVTVSDDGIGFDPARVGPASTGLRNSVRARLSDAGGCAEIISAPGQGTSVVLTWDPPQAATLPVSDPLAWARRMAPSPQLIFAGFMLPILLAGLVLLGLRWQDMRWQAAAAAVLAGFAGLAALSARYLSQVQMPHPAAVSLIAANAILVGVGSLAVAPGTTDSAAYWVGLVSGIVIAAVYFIRGPVSGLTALALDVAAFTAGLVVTGGAIPSLGVRVTILSGPPICAGVAAAMLAAFRNLSSHTESQLAQYQERLRRQARAEAISRVDSAALDNARRVAGPVLSAVISSQAPDTALRTAAALASAALRDELLAPGFLTAALAERLHAARTAQVRVTVKIASQADPELAETARRLLTAALAGLDAGDDVTLQIHPPAEGHPPLLLLHVRSARSSHVALRQAAGECGASVSDLGDHELLLQLQPAPERAAVPAAQRRSPPP